MLKSRWSLYTRAAEIEEKIKDIADDEKAPVSVLFCSSGSTLIRWRISRTATATASSGRTTGRKACSRATWRTPMIAFKRTLAGFHYLERGQFEVMPMDFGMFVRGHASACE